MKTADSYRSYEVMPKDGAVALMVDLKRFWEELKALQGFPSPPRALHPKFISMKMFELN